MDVTAIHLTIPSAYVLTANQRLHWAKKARMTKAIRTTAFLAARDWVRRHGTFDHKVAVVAYLSFPDARRRDPNNWSPTTKAAIDGFVDAGVFVDDSATHINGPDHRPGPTGERGYVGVRFEFLEVE